MVVEVAAEAEVAHFGQKGVTLREIHQPHTLCDTPHALG